MGITRRNFLSGMGIFSAAALFGNPLAAIENPLPDVTTNTLKGKLFALGQQASSYPGNSKQGTSVLTSFDLETRAIKQTLLEMGEGHAAMPTGDGRILCVASHSHVSMMLDKDHNVIETFVSPEGYTFSGHGLIIRDRNLFLMPIHREMILTHLITDTGRLQLYDLTTLKLLDTIDSGGIQPHEIHFIPTIPSEMALTHYGMIFGHKDPLEFNALDPKLTILDSRTFSPKRHYPQKEFNALLTHMRVDEDGWAYAIMTQSVLYKKPTDLGPTNDPEKIALEQLSEVFNQKWDFSVPEDCAKDRKLAVSLPFLRINTQTGERQVINAGLKYHLRSQSVAYNKLMRTAVALYRHSEGGAKTSGNLIFHVPGKDPEVISAEKLKLREVCGVTDIPGTSYIAVNGSLHDVSIMDIKSREILAQFKSDNYDSTHLYHEACI